MPTPGIKYLAREFVTAAKDFYSPLYANLLRHQDDTLTQHGGSKGLKLYDEILRDPHAWSVFQKRVLAVVSREWEVEPASTRLKDRKAAELVTELLEAMDLDGLTLALSQALLKGLAVVEVMWEVQNSTIVPKTFIPRDPRLFQFVVRPEGGYEMQLRSWTGDVAGEPIPPRKLLAYSWGSSTANPYGLGLGTRLFWPCYFKRQLEGFWLDYCERCVTPIAVATSPDGISVDVQTRLQDVMDEWGQRTGILVPSGTQVEVFTSPTAGAAFESLVRYLDEEISKAVLGETLTTTMKSGSLAAAQVQNSVRLELVQADADLVCAFLSDTLVRWIVELNSPGAGFPRLRRVVKAEADLLETAQWHKLIWEMGFEPSLEYLHEQFGGEWTKIAPKPAPTAPEPEKTTIQAKDAQKDPEEETEDFAEPAAADLDAVDELTRQTIRHAEAPMAVLVDQLRQAVRQADSLESLRDTLDGMFPDLDASTFTEVMTRALSLAGLMGRFEVMQEAANRRRPEVLQHAEPAPINLNLTVKEPKQVQIVPQRDEDGRITGYHVAHGEV